jgi:hypothetical protein
VGQTDPRRLSGRDLCAGRPHDVAAVTFRARPARFLDCVGGGSTHSGHVLLAYRRAGVTVTVSLHGHTAVNRRLDRAIARGVVLVRRAPPRRP